MEETNWKTSFSLFYCTNILTGKQRNGANQIRVSSYFLISSVRSTLYNELQLDNLRFPFRTIITEEKYVALLNYALNFHHVNFPFKIVSILHHTLKYSNAV